MTTTLITGGTGLIGRQIIDRLQQNPDHKIIVLTRQPQKARRIFGSTVLAVTSLTDIPDNQTIDTVFNLAGAGIADKRWTTRRKQQLRDSRILLTRQLVGWLQQRPQRPTVLVSCSAVGWYGDQQDTLLTEHSDFHEDFAHQLCEDWEQAALAAQSSGIRVAIVRTGLVLSTKGGFLNKLLPPFKLGLGGPIGSGRQYMPWVHIDDIRDLFLFLADSQGAEGVFNGCAPNPVSNDIFSKTLAAELNRPAIFRIPACVLKPALGEMAGLLLGGQRAVPEKVKAAGFSFTYTELQPALNAVLKKT